MYNESNNTPIKTRSQVKKDIPMNDVKKTPSGSAEQPYIVRDLSQRVDLKEHTQNTVFKDNKDIKDQPKTLKEPCQVSKSLKRKRNDSSSDLTKKQRNNDSIVITRKNESTAVSDEDQPVKGAKKRKMKKPVRKVSDISVKDIMKDVCKKIEADISDSDDEEEDIENTDDETDEDSDAMEDDGSDSGDNDDEEEDEDEDTPSKLFNNPKDAKEYGNIEELVSKIRNKNNKKLFKNFKPEQQTEYESLVKDVEEMPTELAIITSSYGRERKLEMMKLFYMLDRLEPFSSDFFATKGILMKLLKQPKEIIESEEKMLSIVKTDDTMKKRILESEMSDDHKKVVFEKYMRLDSIEASDPTRGKIKEWIDYALSMPQTLKQVSFNSMKGAGKSMDVIEYLSKVRKHLDSKLYGLEKVKEEIMIVLANIITNSNSIGHALAMVGPPGVGKTEIIKALSEALELPFEQISLGGANDASYIDGHTLVYEGSAPGIIAKSLKRMGYKNGIIYFDEFDKLSSTDKGQEVSKNLLHVTDFTQNSKFRDKYLDEITIDLSHIWFIYSLNNENEIDPVLRDRIPIIRVTGYAIKDKIEIARKYLFPALIKNVGMDTGDIIISDASYTHLINTYCAKEEGVRSLKRYINDIVRKINLLKVTDGNMTMSFKIKDFRLPYTVNCDTIDMLLKNSIVDENSSKNMHMYI